MTAAADRGRWRFVIVALALVAVVCAFPAVAGARGAAFRPDKKSGATATGLKAFTETGQLPSGSAIEPAIAAAPSGAGKEWLLASSGSNADLLAISSSGKVTRVSSALPHGDGAIPGNGGALASYGGVVTGGYDWLVKYGQLTSPLYAVSPSGKVTKVLASVGSNITDVTKGADGTLDFSSTTQSIGLESCAIVVPLAESGANDNDLTPSVDCHSPFPLFSVIGSLTSWGAGQGQIESIAADDGRLWFTDSEGQLGSFGLAKALDGSSDLKHLFSEPYGDSGSGAAALGEGAAQPDTVAADGADIYIAAGAFKSAPYADNHEILEVKAAVGKIGKTVRTWDHGLTNVTAITAGPAGNIWFLDSKSAKTGAGEVGELKVKTGKITQYKLTRGYRFGPYIAQIAAGPTGTGTLYYTLETKSGGPAIGKVYGANN